MPGGIEQAIVRFATEGVSDVENASEKITADLSSAQRAGVSAKAASDAAASSAKDGTAASREFQIEMRHGIHALHAAVALAERMAAAAGIDESSAGGRALAALGGAASGGAQGARLGSFVGGPEGGLAGAAIGALVGAASSIVETGRRLEEREARQREIDERHGQNELHHAVLREIGLSQVEWSSGASARSVQ